MRFFLVDRVDAIEPGRSVSGIKNLTLSDEVFFDHFPQYPTYPGSLLIEAMAQLGGLLAECSYHAEYPDTRRAVLAQVDRAQFHATCGPGDQLRLEGRLASLLSAAARVEASAQRGTETIASAQLTFRLVNVDAPQLHRQRLELYALWTRHLSPRPEFR